MEFLDWPLIKEVKLELFSSEFFSALLAIIVIDLVLAGDNAIVIAMAASLNVKSAVSSGLLAVLAGLLPVLLAFWIFKVLIKKLGTS
jgi:predicted tellurium resistance membrane protein TerC